MYTYQRGSKGTGTGVGTVREDSEKQLGLGTFLIQISWSQTCNSNWTLAQQEIPMGLGLHLVRNILVPLKLRVISSFTVLEILSPVCFLQGCKVFYNHLDWLSVVNCFNCWKYLQTEKIHLRKGSHQWVSVVSLFSLIDKFYWQVFFIESRDKLSFPGCTILH